MQISKKKKKKVKVKNKKISSKRYRMRWNASNLELVRRIYIKREHLTNIKLILLPNQLHNADPHSW